MRILAIETSCDETAVAIVEARGNMQSLAYTVIGDALYSQAQKHAAYGGVFPSLAKREHAGNLVPLLEAALKQAGLLNVGAREIDSETERALREFLEREQGLYGALATFAATHPTLEVDAIAVTRGPGLEPALWVGINFARALSKLYSLPIIPVNHLEGHVLASAVVPQSATTYSIEELRFPVLALILSGGHTEFVYSSSWGNYAVVGATRDDSVGEAYDKVARLLGLPYPGGPGLAALAERGRAAPRPIRTMHSKEEDPLPRPMLKSGDLDFSFSGLKTAVLYRKERMGELSDPARAQLAASFEEAVKDVVLAKTALALTKHKAATFLLGGGVSANSYLRASLETFFASQKETTLRLPARGLSTDNAVMIAMAGYIHHLRGDATVQADDVLTAQGSMRLGERPRS